MQEQQALPPMAPEKKPFSLLIFYSPFNRAETHDTD